MNRNKSPANSCSCLLWLIDFHFGFCFSHLFAGWPCWFVCSPLAMRRPKAANHNKNNTKNNSPNEQKQAEKQQVHEVKLRDNCVCAFCCFFN